MEECDTLLMVGTSFPYIEFLPKPGQARAVQIDARSRRGSACATRSRSAWSATAAARSQALLPLLQRKNDRSFLEQAQAGMKEWWRADGASGARGRTSR